MKYAGLDGPHKPIWFDFCQGFLVPWNLSCCKLNLCLNILSLKGARWTFRFICLTLPKLNGAKKNLQILPLACAKNLKVSRKTFYNTYNFWVSIVYLCLMHTALFVLTVWRVDDVLVDNTVEFWVVETEIKVEYKCWMGLWNQYCS